MIEVKNLVKRFEDKEILKGISATFKGGECSLIIGKSGAGKTVLLKSIVGLVDPDEGEVLYDGRSFYGMTERSRKELRREIGMLFQGSALFDSMTVLENVLFPLDMFSSYTAQKRCQIAKECLERVMLSDAYKKYPNEISGGMMKRAAIARAIALSPKYLFCDEPNSGLDPETSQHIDLLIQSITRESDITTIVNTHDMNSVENIGDHVLFVHKGSIEWEGTSKEIDLSDNKLLKNFVYINQD